MNDTKVNPNIIIHNAILDCCVECGDTKLLNEIYDSIKKKAIENQSDDSTPQPDLITYSTVIKGHARAKDMDKVFDIYNFLKENSSQYKMDEVIFNSILDGCAKTGNFEKAMSIATDMNSLSIPKSNVTYSILVKIYAGAKQTEKALDLLNEMESEGIKPGVIVYTCLIQTSLKSKQFERAINLFEKMKKSGCKADHVLYNTIING
jgi:pentatricopeptide repeat protein